jgi:hypothetical protein
MLDRRPQAARDCVQPGCIERAVERLGAKAREQGMLGRVAVLRCE